MKGAKFATLLAMVAMTGSSFHYPEATAKNARKRQKYYTTDSPEVKRMSKPNNQ